MLWVACPALCRCLAQAVLAEPVVQVVLEPAEQVQVQVWVAWEAWEACQA